MMPVRPGCPDTRGANGLAGRRVSLKAASTMRVLIIVALRIARSVQSHLLCLYAMYSLLLPLSKAFFSFGWLHSRQIGGR